MDKLHINIEKGKATIEEGEDTFLGKIIKSAGKINFDTPRIRKKMNIVKKSKEEKEKKA